MQFVTKLATATVVFTTLAVAEPVRDGTTLGGELCRRFCDGVRNSVVLTYYRLKGETAVVQTPAVSGKPPHCGRLPDQDMACCKSSVKRLYIEYVPMLGTKTPWKPFCQ